MPHSNCHICDTAERAAMARIVPPYIRKGYKMSTREETLVIKGPSPTDTMLTELARRGIAMATERDVLIQQVKNWEYEPVHHFSPNTPAPSWVTKYFPDRKMIRGAAVGGDCLLYKTDGSKCRTGFAVSFTLVNTGEVFAPWFAISMKVMTSIGRSRDAPLIERKWIFTDARLNEEEKQAFDRALKMPEDIGW